MNLAYGWFSGSGIFPKILKYCKLGLWIVLFDSWWHHFEEKQKIVKSWFPSEIGIFCFLPTRKKRQNITVWGGAKGGDKRWSKNLHRIRVFLTDLQYFAYQENVVGFLLLSKLKTVGKMKRRDQRKNMRDYEFKHKYCKVWRERKLCLSPLWTENESSLF